MMNISLNIFINFIVFTFFVGCSTEISNSSISNAEVPENQIIGGGDCYVPIPEKKNQTGSGTMNLKTDNGTPIEVSVTGFKPADDFFFTMKPDRIAQENGQSGVFLQLDEISEFKANDKIFAYFVYTIYPQPDNSESKVINRMEGRRGAFRCFDLNGDGKFEYPTDNGSEPMKVPNWVIG
jgi:hypothetical protein